MISPNRTSLFPFWDWLSTSSFIGVVKVEHREMAMFESEVTDELVLCKGLQLNTTLIVQ